VPRRKDPPTIFEFVIDHTAAPVKRSDFIDSICDLVEALPDDVQTLAVNEADDHPFSPGSYAFSRVHNRVVRVWSRRGTKVNVTLDLFEEHELRTDRVKETDLMAWSEFLAWAPQQTWYMPPTGRDMRALLEHFRNNHPPTARRPE